MPPEDKNIDGWIRVFRIRNMIERVKIPAYITNKSHRYFFLYEVIKAASFLRKQSTGLFQSFICLLYIKKGKTIKSCDIMEADITMIMRWDFIGQPGGILIYIRKRVLIYFRGEMHENLLIKMLAAKLLC